MDGANEMFESIGANISHLTFKTQWWYLVVWGIISQIYVGVFDTSF